MGRVSQRQNMDITILQEVISFSGLSRNLDSLFAPY